MRTSVDIDDQLLLYAKRQTVQQGCTLKQVLEDALRNFFFFFFASISLARAGKFGDFFRDRFKTRC